VLHEASMITGAQIRAARALLGLTTGGLAQRCMLLQKTIQRAESTDGVPALGSFDREAIKTTLEDAGIEFVGDVGVKMAHDPNGPKGL
jgi:hypothetical protein